MARRKRRGNRRNLRRMPVARCRKCSRTIFGGPKGMRTHSRKCGKKRRRARR